jgi:hypothetical protein
MNNREHSFFPNSAGLSNAFVGHISTQMNPSALIRFATFFAIPFIFSIITLRDY